MKQETYLLFNESSVQTTPLMKDLTKRVDISIIFKHLEINRTKDSNLAAIHYPINIYLCEAVSDSKSSALVPFMIKAKTDSEIATFTLRGAAHIKGSYEEIEELVTSNKGRAPKIWTMIYQETIAMLAKLSKFTHKPLPYVIM